jgi:2-dehydropantoate 2-reductase
MFEKLAVLGAGAIGSIIGAYLARAGRDITLIDMWPAHVEQMRRAGLKVTAAEAGEFQVPVNAIHLGDVAGLRTRFDAVFLSVKSYDTKWAATFIEPYLASRGVVVSAQNSINEEQLGTVLGYTRILGCVATLGAGLYEPGHVTRTTLPSRPPFAVGEVTGMATPRAKAIAEILSPVGPTKVTCNLWGERWSKLTTNSMLNALASITLMNNAELRQNQEVFDITLQIAGEAIAVAQALGVHVEPINGIDPAVYLEAARGNGVEALRTAWVEGGRTVGAGRPSLLQDVLKARRTEIDHLNGLVARKGRETGIPTPMNDAIITVTKRVESGELTPAPENLKLFAPGQP